mmetsp:Transcript_1306/g.2027  ORF Transcript_1306/g.2027 Transcript_1306/m.2027 type:complete len:334 (-) Transcript_1306:51-1052(-)
MTRLPSKLRDFLMVQKRFTAQPSFSNALGLSPKHILQKDDSETKPLVSTSKEGVAQYCYRYAVPNHACVKSIDGRDDVFPTSAILAVFDDLTTLAIVNEDKNARPGVSTSLSANLSPYGMTRLPKAGDELDIFVKVIKIGKTFGFTEAEAVCSETGAVIAIGKHTKFLNTGSLLQKVILGPTILPIASRAASMYQPNDSNATNTISMSDLFRLDPSREKQDGSILVLRKEHMNPMGTCHGGAIAMAMEQFASKTLTESGKGSLLQNLRLQSMSINYISTAHEHLLFSSENSFQFESSAMIDVRVSGDHGRKTADGVLHYVCIDDTLREISSRL